MRNPTPRSVLVTAPTANPVTTAAMKSYLRLDTTDDDAELDAIMLGAASYLEKYLDQKLMPQKWNVFYDYFPGDYNFNSQAGVIEGSIRQVMGNGSILNIPFGPLVSVQDLTTYADDDTAFVCDPSTYYVDTSASRPCIALRMGQVWPTTILRPVAGVRVQVNAGYPDAALIPAEIIQAYKMLVAKVYENRGDDLAGEAMTLPSTAAMLLEPHRRIKI